MSAEEEAGAEGLRRLAVVAVAGIVWMEWLWETIVMEEVCGWGFENGGNCVGKKTIY